MTILSYYTKTRFTTTSYFSLLFVCLRCSGFLLNHMCNNGFMFMVTHFLLCI